MKKASERIKTTISVKEIEERIDQVEKNHSYQNKIFIPHFENVSNDTKLQFMNAGYKVYNRDWDGVMKDVLIIEW